MAEKWEYRVRRSDSVLEDYDLNRYGDVGWELVNFTIEPGEIVGSSFLVSGTRVGKKYVYIFKRPKK